MNGAETIVVGAGAAGAVIASRVTEESAREVLLIEAGPDYPPEVKLPDDLANGTHNSMRDHDWGYHHRPNSRQMKLPMPRGRVVGGSSAVNTTIAVRGIPADYDEWAGMGLPDWSFDQCLPAFIRMERDLDHGGPFHGRDGPLPLHRPTAAERSPWANAFLEACAEAGLPLTDDHNLPDATGAGPHALNNIANRRISAAEAWLTAAVRARPNLRILPQTQVLRVLFDHQRVTGVEVLRKGLVERISARRVVLAGGAIGTPEVLLRSGIGPQAELDRLGVRRIADLPVAERLLDHPGFAQFWVPRPGVRSTRHPVIQAALRFRSYNGEFDNDSQIQPGSFVPLPRGSLPLVSLMAAVGKPLGHGTIRWPSLAPGARPEISGALLDHPVDRARAVESMTIAYALIRTKALSSRLIGPAWPGHRVLRDRSRTDAWIRRATDSGYHPSGTAPMGADDDKRAVCDGRGRVRGVRGLIVADASLMPTIPTSNTHLPTLMIGERFGLWLKATPD